MKTTYTCFIAALISFSTISAQSLPSSPQGVSRGSLKANAHFLLPAVVQDRKESVRKLSIERSKMLPSRAESPASSTEYKSPKKVACQSNATGYLLDSIVSTHGNGINYSKQVWVYDILGNKINYTTYFWNAPYSNTWTQNEYSTYDIDGNKTLYDYNYSASGYYGYWGLRRFITEYFYDSNRNQTHDSTSVFDNNSWKTAGKTEHNYDSNGRDTLSVVYTWDSGWALSSKTEHNYDSNGHDTLSVSYAWDPNSGWGVPISKVEQHYDSNGNQTLSKSYRFFPDWEQYETDMWEPLFIYLHEYTYDINERIEIDTAYSGFGYYGIWPYTKTQYTYDDNGNTIFRDVFYFNTSSSTREEYVFNDRGDIDKIRHYTGNGNLEWVLTQQVDTYFYSPKTTTAVTSPTTMQLTISPNPATDEIRISGLTENSKLTLLDLNGKIVITKDVVNDATVSVSSLSKGLYIVKVIGSKGSFVSKLIKE